MLLVHVWRGVFRALVVWSCVAVVIGVSLPLTQADVATNPSWCASDSPYGNAGTGNELNVPAGTVYTMGSDQDWHNVTVNAGATLDTAGFRLRVCGTLTNYGTITDSHTGGAGGMGGNGGLGGDHYGVHPAGCGNRQDVETPGGTGAYGAYPSSPQSGQDGRGGRGGGGGGGGGTAWHGLTENDADGGNGASGGDGGQGGGYVHIWAYCVDNQGVIQADGMDGCTGEAAPEGDSTDPNGYENCGAEYWWWMYGLLPRDVSGGGGGGGGGGAGGNGGTIEINYCHLLDHGEIHAAGGDGGNGGDGGTKGGCCVYNAIVGGYTSGASGGNPNGGDGGRGCYSTAGGSCTTDGDDGYGGADGADGDVTLSQVDCGCPGDLNGDNQVDIGDLQILLSNYGQSGMSYEDGDLNADGLVDMTDLQLLLAAYGSVCD